ncbi:hypothetical protein CC80DRAFT_566153 [Byssothecium circinans]|uniref:F-box domain-containing protein n=1 Tax=Byssothecium circinans TaxID=147558 RepID=A0A6A5U190_9PLEO|nr:hypothetical protein CC80DRAFT_566153 [Byssothecium circinans]
MSAAADSAVTGASQEANEPTISDATAPAENLKDVKAKESPEEDKNAVVFEGAEGGGVMTEQLAKSGEPRKGLLDLCPEIRNRIYDYATEPFTERVEADDDDRVDPPLLSFLFENKSPYPRSTYSSRQFFGLTQTCQQIRTEYRPVWLRNSIARIRFHDLKYFLAIFYPKENNIGPKILQIVWDGNKDCGLDRMVDLLPLLHLRASNENTRVEFIPYAHLEWKKPQINETFNWNDILNRQEYLYFDGRRHLVSLNNMFNHNNAKWFSDIRDRKVTKLGIAHSSTDRDMEVHIRLSEATATHQEGANLRDCAWTYLESVGISRASAMVFGLTFVVTVALDPWGIVGGSDDEEFVCEGWSAGA